MATEAARLEIESIEIDYTGKIVETSRDDRTLRGGISSHELAKYVWQ